MSKTTEVDDVLAAQVGEKSEKSGVDGIDVVGGEDEIRAVVDAGEGS